MVPGLMPAAVGIAVLRTEMLRPPGAGVPERGAQGKKNAGSPRQPRRSAEKPHDA